MNNEKCVDDGCQVSPPESQVIAELGSLDIVIDELGETIGSLEQRLFLVLIPQTPQKTALTKDSIQQPDPELVPLAGRISNARCRIAEIEKRARGIWQRLEI